MIGNLWIKARTFSNRLLKRFFKTTDYELEREDVASHFDIDGFFKRYGYKPKNSRLFLQSLLHRSFVPLINIHIDSNERLEFLGDAILNFLVAEYLYDVHPRMPEGGLTKLRSRLVNRKTLVHISCRIKLTDFIKLGESAAQAVKQGADAILADAYEAVICAIYLDGGLNEARSFIHRTLLSDPAAMKLARQDENYKSALLEYAQARGLGAPRYVTQRLSGPDHERVFTIAAVVDNKTIGVGTGRNKKEAEQAAAAEAIKTLRNNSSAERKEDSDGV